MHLTASERIILHVSEHWRVAGPVDELTQKGISAGAELLRSHVPRNLKKLIAEGHIVESEGRIGGRGRRLRYYRITESGLRRARDLRDGLLSEKVIHEGHEDTVEQVSRQFGMTPLQVALKTDDRRIFHPPSMELVVHPGLIERDEDLAYLRKWHREGGPAAVVYGSGGMGKTALGRAFVSHLKARTIWVDVKDGELAADIVSDLCQGMEIPNIQGEVRTAMIGKVRSEGILVVFDGYCSVSEDAVDFLAGMLSELKGSPGKFLVLAQETTPSYCRFYGHDSVNRGEVWERHLRGLSMEGCRKMLGADVDKEALKRIYLLTKGTPLYLDLIRRGDVEGLRARSRFTRAEIRLLMFSRGVSAHR